MTYPAESGRRAKPPGGLIRNRDSWENMRYLTTFLVIVLAGCSKAPESVVPMKDRIEQLEYHDLDGEPIWDGVVTVGKDRAELQIEAPKSGPSEAQKDILTELVTKHVPHRRAIFAAVTKVLQSRGIPVDEITEARMSISIVSVSSAEKKSKLVLTVDQKLKGLLGKKYALQTDLVGQISYTASVVE